MKESISSRITRIITGTANSIVSKIEGLAPGAILEQAILEVDGAVDEVRAELGRILVQKHHVTKTLGRLNDEHGKLEEQVGTAIQQGREDLAEVAIGRQVDIEDQLPTLENQLADLAGQEKELNQAIAGLLAKRNEMEEELFEYRRSKPSTVAGVTGEDAAEGGSGIALGKAEKAGNAFKRVLQNETGVRREDLKAGSEDRARLVELAQLNRRAKVESRLKARKAAES